MYQTISPQKIMLDENTKFFFSILVKIDAVVGFQLVLNTKQMKELALNLPVVI